MRTRSTAAIFAILAAAIFIPAAAQKPMVDSRGVLNSATLAPVEPRSYWGPPWGSVATIFGKNLAPAAVSAAQVPLPTILAGVSVVWQFTSPQLSFNTPLPLFYVSPGQINFQIPDRFSPGDLITVHTASGVSDPVQVSSPAIAPGIFTLDGSGCGPAWVLNIAKDGTWSLNSPENGVEPGGLIAVLGTGRGQVFFNGGDLPDDGQPTPSNPLPIPASPGGAGFDVPTDGEPSGGSVLYDNRAPGMIGVDQFNIKLPDNVIEGCGIPLRITYATYPLFADSQPVPINVHRGGGKCGPLPSPQSYADFTLQKTTTIDTSSTTTEQLSVSLSAAVGKRASEPPPGAQVGQCFCDWAAPAGWISGPSCPFPLFADQPVDAGPLTVSGPDLNVRYVPQPNDMAFQINLPNGSVIPGLFTISAPGGAGAGAFSVAVPVPPEIQFANPAPNGTIDARNDFQLKWTGGQADEIVRLRLRDRTTWRFCECAQRASDGPITLYATYHGSYGYLLDPAASFDKNAELTISLESPAPVPFTATGLTLGGVARWTRIWYYPNLTFTY